ncbi:hemerythrin domain-containing protein [Salinisphaera sp. RV14]|uniref:hemerythrin domain-containing protein n=1 Tax=Salinisphaera sp. RV14 TaxID=3454140 RepID=UPI003F854C61
MHDISEALRLPNRETLPPRIAFLREHYPKSRWQVHGNYGELAAFWLEVHDSLRAQGGALQRMTREFREGESGGASAFQRSFMPRLGRYLQHLEGHHHIEDGHYFPRFRALDRRMRLGFDLLENDHEIIHAAVLRVADSARAFMQALARGEDAGRFAADDYIAGADRLLTLLGQHLTDEEDLVIPAMLEHTEQPLR